MIRIISNPCLSWDGETPCALAFTPTPNEKEQYVVAWGDPAGQLESGLRPLAWLEDSSGYADIKNTCEHGAEWYDTITEAEEAIAVMADALYTLEGRITHYDSATDLYHLRIDRGGNIVTAESETLSGLLAEAEDSLACLDD